MQKVDDILVDAMLDPAKARLLLATPSKRTEGQTFKALGQLYRRAAVASVPASLGEVGTMRIGEPVRLDVRRAAGR